MRVPSDLPKRFTFSRRDAAGGLPVVAMVDAFVGALSVILILVVLAQPSQEHADEKPQADLLVRCQEDGRSYALVDLTDPEQVSLMESDIGRDDLVTRLEPYLPPDRLHARVLFEATPERLKCASRGMEVLKLANEDRSQPNSKLTHPIFVSAMRAVEGEVAQ